ncbi:MULTISPECIES: S49 family peptidase [unclassified Thioalkalivibrio]|uniref:S49 family peptidase n=1 Tax=unclassified Thioalkalivibrio TaxID=2621013 RepID=UPI000195A56E|nr:MULTISPECIES: S49 family peptidase [unclassified Thioalkalivibrio]ADC71702.1 peptidase S49 [Thioalkalivibrio sp. K90mix]
MGWSNENKPGWERETLERLVQAQVVEQRRARRWGIFFKLLLFIYLFALLVLVRGGDMGLTAWFEDDREPEEHVAVVEVDGLIASSARANAEELNKTLKRAFEADGTRAVMLRINSGGGSPVQAAAIHDEILRLKDEHEDIPVYAVVTDIGASAAYYIAVAADEIYASQASMVGSIGVRLDSFGVVDLLENIGVERRLFTSGENKALLDPFLPLDEGHVSHIHDLMDGLHQQFVDVVRQGRGDRLAENEELFDGLIWTGQRAVDLGLIDGLGTDQSVARDVIGVEKMVTFKPRRSALQLLFEDLGMSALQSWLAMETKPNWR